MPDTITITGVVATAPRHILTSEGLSITSFRVASAQRRFDRAQERWIDVDTNWYTVVSFRQLALNCATSVERGQRVLVTGRLRIKEWDNGERVGTTIEIEADSIGHDLMWGTAVFSRSIVSSAAPASTEAAAEEGAAQDEHGDLSDAHPGREADPELAVDAATPF